MDSFDVESVIYLDNASTVYPKPLEVLERMFELYRRYGVNPGRAGYDLNLLVEQYVHATRVKLTELFGGDDPERLCFASNGSDALNTLIHGLVRDGDHVVSTTLEHNSVIRPLNHLRRDHSVAVDYVPCGPDGIVDPQKIAAHFRRDTRAVVLNHGSNVVGTIQPVAEIGRLCRARGVLLILDAAQTAGVVPIHVEEMCIDALAFTGHKSLLGPTGIGGLYVRAGIEVRQTRFGGTGVNSARPYHLEDYPFRLEVGTCNVMGVLGLFAAQEYLGVPGRRSGSGDPLEAGGTAPLTPPPGRAETIRRHEMALFARLQQGLSEVEGVRLLATTSLEQRLPVLSFTVDGLDPGDVSSFLDVDHDIAVRTGLHCAPLIHQQLGTAPRGAVRMSVGPTNTSGHIEAAIAAVREIATGRVRNPET